MWLPASISVAIARCSAAGRGGSDRADAALKRRHALFQHCDGRLEMREYTVPRALHLNEEAAARIAETYEVVW